MIKHLTLPKKMAAMVLLAGAALSIAPVQAASYPTKQIELVVPYAAGGGTDLVARAFADDAAGRERIGGFTVSPWLKKTCRTISISPGAINSDRMLVSDAENC